MVSFKEFLIKENVVDDLDNIRGEAENNIYKGKDPIKFYIYKHILNNRKNSFSKLNSSEKKEELEKINKYIEEKNEELKAKNEKELNTFKDIADLEKVFKEVKSVIDNTRLSRSGDLSKVKDPNEFKKQFYQSLINEKDSIAKLNGNKVEEIASIFSKSNRDGNREIDKREFVNAIKIIQNKYKNDLEIPATILWLLFLKQETIDRGDELSIFNNKGNNSLSSNSQAAAALKNDNGFYFKDGQKTEHFDDLILLFNSFENLQIEKSVLRNFRNINAAKKLLSKDIEDVEKTASGDFTEKDHPDIKKDEGDKNDKSEIKNEFIKRKKWYIFDTTPPENENDDVEEFVNNFKDECSKILNDIVAKIDTDENAPKDRSKNIDENIINKFFKNTVTEERLEDNRRFFELLKKELNEEKDKANFEISDMIDDMSEKAFKKRQTLRKISNYKDKNDAEAEFRQIFIDYGYKISKRIRDFTKKADEIFKNIKLLKRVDDRKDNLSPEQKGQNEIVSKNFTSYLSKASDFDHCNIARYMVINVLMGSKNSQEVFDLLSKNNFNDLKGFVYVGNSGKVFAFDRKNIKIEKVGNYTFYDFDQTKAKAYKNPSELISSAFKIDINSLTPEVLKEVKKNVMNFANEAKTYIENANKLKIYFESFVKNTFSEEVLKEGLFGNLNNNLKNADVENAVNNNFNNKNTDNSDIIKTMAKQIKLPKECVPTENGVEDLALRQFLKGFTLIIDNNGNQYLTSLDKTKKIKEMIKNKNAEVKSKNAEDGTQINDQATQNAVKFNSDATSGQVYDSVVTSSAADSTYGDGYGYNKKADAIKKKLNCTTYTYSPNPKMKIVRRTFD